MRRALELARQAWGRTHPNPMVGALIVEDGAVVAEGWHRMAGGPHAEIEAIRALGRAPAENAVMYVTLEPCSTCGRTGACTEAIVAAGIRRVVVGAVDPNPDHAGQGLDWLRAQGVEVTVGVLANECVDLNLIFNHWIIHKTPFVAAKMATTLDGKFAAASGHSKWVTGALARADVMRWRRYFPAIAVGANTVMCDDPSLTSRIDGETWCPVRFVLDRALRTAEWEPVPKLYVDAHKHNTIVLCAPSAHSAMRRKLESFGVAVWEIPERNAHFDWSAFRQRCADAGITGVYIESGPSLATGLLEGRHVDYVFMYQAPKFLGDSASLGIGSSRDTQSMEDAIHLTEIRHAFLGDDILIRGRL